MSRSDGSKTPLALCSLVLVGVAPLLLSAFCGGGSGSAPPDLEPFTTVEEQLLHGIRDTMADVRGLDINPETKEGTLSREANRQYFEEELSDLDEAEEREFEAFDVAMRLLHLIGPDDETLEFVTDFYGDDVAGFYMQEHDLLALIADAGDVISPRDEITLAHEYVHSFQHARFGIDRLNEYADNEDDESRTEYATTISCLIEGDATLSMYLYAEEVYGENWPAVVWDEDATEPPASDREVPPGIERYFYFDYAECYWFVQALYDEGGWAAVNAAYANPPSTTEQILHPERYHEGEAPRSPAPDSLEETLGDGWSLYDLSPFGEFDVYNYLATVLGDDLTAYIAAEGWGSGWTSIYVADQDNLEGDPTVLVHLRLDWDTTFDFVEFLGAFGDAIEIVSEGNWEMDRPNTTLTWDNVDEHGYVTWDEDLNRIDVVVSSEPGPRASVAEAQLLRR